MERRRTGENDSGKGGERDGEREKAGRKCKSLKININAQFRGTRVYA